MKTLELKKETKLQKLKKSLFIGCTILTASIITSCDGNYSERSNKDKIEINDEIINDNKIINNDDKEINDNEKIDNEITDNELNNDDKYKLNSLCPKDLEDRFDLDNVSGKFDRKSKATIDDEIQIKNSPFVNETTLNGEYARLLTYCIDDVCSEHGITIQENKQYSYEINGEIITFEGCYVRENEDMVFSVNKEKTITNFYIPCSLEYGDEEKENYELWDNSQETTITYGKITGDKCEDNNQEIILKYETSFEKLIKWKNEYTDGVDRTNIFVDGEEYFVSQVNNDEMKLYKEIIYNENMKVNEIIEIEGNEIQLIDLGEKVTLLVNGEERTISEKRRRTLKLNEENYEVRIYSINKNEKTIEIGISQDKDNISIRGLGYVGHINITSNNNWEIRESYKGTINEEGVLGYTIEYNYNYQGEHVEDKK